ncbi:MAG: glycosyltransferase family 2 protein [Gammaproteobacteria bacterium]|nr:glycosyltransferase family 2 protein [Gammaproteobacteria bacterium]NNM01104.1 glycosyltransferase family 2 protein [Gammaproteobacteria bacterium]
MLRFPLLHPEPGYVHGSPISTLPQHRLSVVIPVYNEEENGAPMVDAVHDALRDYPHPWELIVVDDGSRDSTAERLLSAARTRGAHVRVVRLQRNFGQTAAMQAGVDAARGDVIATLDGDLQNDPTDIPAMVARLLHGDLDLVAGWRKDRQDSLVVRRLPSLVANRIISRVTGVRLQDYGCSLKVYRARVLKQIRLFGEMHRFIPVWIASVTSPSRISEMPVNHRARSSGESKYGLSRTFRVIVDLLTVFFFLHFRSRPGHFFGGIGLIFGALGGAALGYLLYVKVILGEDIGSRPLLFTGILFAVVSIQFLTTGVLAELLSRTFFETSEHLPYHVLDDQGAAGDAAWHEREPATAAAIDQEHGSR